MAGQPAQAPRIHDDFRSISAGASTLAFCKIQMEALAELVMIIVTFLIEVTIHSLVFIFLLLMAIFSPHYRKNLRDQWDTSNWHRLAIVCGVTMYSTALIVALLFWTPLLHRSSNEVATTDQNKTITIKFTDDEVQRMKKTKEIDQLVDIAGNIIKRKLTERRKEAEQGVDGKPPEASQPPR